MRKEEERLLSVLKAAKAQEKSWYDVAEALYELNKRGSTNESGRLWVLVAEDISGYSRNMLSRMLRMYDFVNENVANGNFKTISDAIRLPFSYLETLNLIKNIDEEAFRFILRDVISQKLSTYRELRVVYQKLRDSVVEHKSSMQVNSKTSAMIITKSAARHFKDKCINLIHKYDILKISSGDILKENIAFEFCSPDYTIIRNLEGSFNSVEAIDCFNFNEISSGSVIKYIIKIEFEASFFDIFWIIMPVRWADYVIKLCKKLYIYNIGVVPVDDSVSRIVSIGQYYRKFDENLPFNLQLEWPHSTPHPDRRKILRDHLIERFEFKFSRPGNRMI